MGGQALLFSIRKLRFPLIGDNVGGVLFWDAGNVYSRLQDISFRYSQPHQTQSVTANGVNGPATQRTFSASTTWCTQSASAFATGLRLVRCGWTWRSAQIPAHFEGCAGYSGRQLLQVRFV